MTWKKPVFRLELPIDLNNGNDGRGGKWFRSSVLRDKYQVIIPKRIPFEFRVNVMVTRFMWKPRQREWDSDSWQRGNLKEIIDAATANGWFHDDSPKFIKEMRCAQIPQKQTGRTTPGTMLELFQAI